MLLTLMVTALITALATTVSVIAINNLQSSTRAQQAGAALNAADAGLAQAMTYLRTTGVRRLACSPNCGSTNAYGSQSNPTTVSIGGEGGQSYKVWISPVAPFPANNPGLYRIFSTGYAAGAAQRTVTADIGVTTSNVPLGIFARTINGGGSASVTGESIFSTGCVYDRAKINMVPGQLDLAYGIPIGVHSSQIITESNGTGQYCPETNQPIHQPGTRCNTTYPYDQDRLGGSLAGTGCTAQSSYPAYYAPQDLDGDGSNDVNGSYIKDDKALYKLFGIRRPALTQAQIDELRTVAQTQGNYHIEATGWSSPDEADAVMFFDLKGTNAGGTVDLNDITSHSRLPNIAATDAACPAKSLTIVIEGGNATLNSNQQLAASLFLTSSAPYGQVSRANGTANFIGTIYADTVNLVGNVDLSMDTCFLANSSPALLALTSGNYRELDR
jgi:hypothetical protein